LKFFAESDRVARAKPKPKTGERPQSILLTPQQAAFVDAKMQGKNNIDAARDAGYKGPVANGARVEKTASVQAALAAARDELSSAAQITRADVIDGFMEAINMAKLAADPASMIKGWSETAKVLGLYAPEVKKVEISGSQKRLQSKYEAMSDMELLDIIEGRVKLIEGESVRVED
jgi:phage terminase small subunit